MKTIFHLFKRTDYLYNVNDSTASLFLLIKTLPYYNFHNLPAIQKRFIVDWEMYIIDYNIEMGPKEYDINMIKMDTYIDYTFGNYVAFIYGIAYNYAVLIRISD